jgi:hypothetical protein
MNDGDNGSRASFRWSRVGAVKTWRQVNRCRLSRADANVHEERVMNEDVSELGDFQVIADRVRVTETIAELTARYKELNQEMTRRETLRWMLP